MQEIEKVYNETFAFDEQKQNPNDIVWEELATSWKEDLLNLPKRVLLNDWKILNQKATKLCVAFWTTNWVNESLNFYGFTPDKEPNILAWYIRKYLDPLIDKRWTWMVYWPKWAEKLDWIEGYTQVNTLKWIKQSVFLWLAIATWTNKLSWGKTWKNAVAVKWNGWWHFISIVGYDDEMEMEDWYWKKYKWFLIVENTWGEKWGDKWRYYIPYEMALEILYNTKKNIIPNKNKARKHLLDLIDEVKKEKEKRKVKPKIVKKYEYFAEDYEVLETENSKNLFYVLQNILRETWFKPIFRTIIGADENETINRILQEIYWARMWQRIRNLK